ncbi:hypothetical protein Patl1_12905 [Pistacia atlantica]|uniref:Uncharacterized protein n=1 Tax=Pistacia atlantica TaxID=434234 RepID=A0ACC1ASY6_9ROSI|nr:hypothetical protein Patl1_12905 [Pistacia atlantica]
MVPNLDLILLAFLHGSLIAFVLLLLVFLIVILMSLAFCLSLLSIIAIDLSTVYSTYSPYFETVEADLELGFFLFLCMILRYAIDIVSASQSWLQRVVPEFKEKGRHVITRMNAELLKARR